LEGRNSETGKEVKYDVGEKKGLTKTKKKKVALQATR